MKRSNLLFDLLFLFLFLVITILSVYIIVDYKLSKFSLVIRNEIIQNEYDKVWWKENFEYVKKMSIEQLNQTKGMYGDSLSNTTTTTNINSQTAQNETLSRSDQIEFFNKLKQDSYILWDKNAKITMIEYSDLECPYCAKFHNEWTIKKLLEKYPWDFNYIFKHYPLPSHKQAPMEAEAAECVWELWWEEKFFLFIDRVFTTTKSSWNSFSALSISELASEIWVSKDEVYNCINSWKYKQKIDNSIYEWWSLWVSWTPSSIIINNETGQFNWLPWAYPIENYISIIDSFLK